MFCTRCGTQVVEGHRFCQACGQEVGAAIAVPPLAPSEPPPAPAVPVERTSCLRARLRAGSSAAALWGILGARRRLFHRRADSRRSVWNSW